MSIKVMQAVIACRDPRLKGAPRVLLLVLAWHADDNGVGWPRQELLAAEAGIAERTVRSATLLAERLGYLNVARSYDHERKRQAVNFYTVQVDALAAGDASSNAHDAASARSALGAGDAARLAAGDAGPWRQEMPHNRKDEPSVEPEPSDGSGSASSARSARSRSLARVEPGGSTREVHSRERMRPFLEQVWDHDTSAVYVEGKGVVLRSGKVLATVQAARKYIAHCELVGSPESWQP